MRYPRVQPDPRGGTSHSFLLQLSVDARRILDVGCATGYLGEALAARDQLVWGLEMDPEAAEQARATGCYQQVVTGNLEEISLAKCFPESSFDAVLFGDVLEHLVDPEQVLADARTLLDTAGFIVASIPNIAHASVRMSLVAGEFPYQEFGLLDHTHLRFFTLDSIKRMFERTGFTLDAVRRVTVDLLDSELAVPDLPKSIVDWIGRQPDALTYQFVVKALRDRPENLAPLDAAPHPFPLSAGAKRYRELVSDVTRLNNELNLIHNSFWWPLFMRVNSIRTRLAPAGTRRDKLLMKLKLLRQVGIP